MEVDHFINFPDVCKSDLQQDIIGHRSGKWDNSKFAVQ